MSADEIKELHDWADYRKAHSAHARLILKLLKELDVPRATIPCSCSAGQNSTTAGCPLHGTSTMFGPFLAKP